MGELVESEQNESLKHEVLVLVSLEMRKSNHFWIAVGFVIHSKFSNLSLLNDVQKFRIL